MKVKTTTLIASVLLALLSLVPRGQAQTKSTDTRTGGRVESKQVGLRDRASHKHIGAEECPVDVDFGFRDTLPQTDTPKEKWDTDTKWGPGAKSYPEFKVPECVKDRAAYQRKRVVAVAMKYQGLPYMHKHIPAAGGLDCSNFTSWVYNYGFGIRVASGVGKQAETAGRRLGADEKFEPGDLLFQTHQQSKAIAHVVIYIGDGKIIDATKGKVAVRTFGGWYKDRLSHARRIIE